MEVLAMMQTDPVCKMQVDTDKSQNKSDYHGKTYAFCSSSCKEKFEQNPAQYTQQMAGQGQGKQGPPRT
jgi:YHS domain-containing protein